MGLPNPGTVSVGATEFGKPSEGGTDGEVLTLGFLTHNGFQVLPLHVVCIEALCKEQEQSKGGRGKKGALMTVSADSNPARISPVPGSQHIICESKTGHQGAHCPGSSPSSQTASCIKCPTIPPYLFIKNHCHHVKAKRVPDDRALDHP